MAVSIVVVLMVISAIINWLSVSFRWRVAAYITKPVTLVLLIVWSLMISGWEGQLLWFGLALIASLAGDVFLMIERLPLMDGMVAFLIAHVFYIIGFNDKVPPAEILSLVFAVAVVIVAYFVLAPLNRAIVASENRAPYRLPVLIYGSVISLMLLSVLLTWARPDWSWQASLIATAGAVSFFASDSILAYSLFVKSYRFSNLVVMITYHLGQFAILCGAILHFNGRLF